MERSHDAFRGAWRSGFRFIVCEASFVSRPDDSTVNIHPPLLIQTSERRPSSFDARQHVARLLSLTILTCSPRLPLWRYSETSLLLGLLTAPRYTLIQNTAVPSGYRSNAYGDHKQHRLARFPPVFTGHIRIARPLAILSTPCAEGPNPSDRYFRPIGHPPVSLCRNRQPTGMRGVPISSWDRLPSQRSDEEPVLANQGSMQEP
jgi:hypothetical protein